MSAQDHCKVFGLWRDRHYLHSRHNQMIRVSRARFAHHIDFVVHIKLCTFLYKLFAIHTYLAVVKQGIYFIPGNAEASFQEKVSSQRVDCYLRCMAIFTTKQIIVRISRVLLRIIVIQIVRGTGTSLSLSGFL
uniref:Uncharacterized protein n=1 Tax=Anopheles atroparvus TaxID=41427 RepID=A0AAG5CU02_ANOAO